MSPIYFLSLRNLMGSLGIFLIVPQKLRTGCLRKADIPKIAWKSGDNFKNIWDRIILIEVNSLNSFLWVRINVLVMKRADPQPAEPGGPHDPSAFPRRDSGSLKGPKPSHPDPAQRAPEPTQAPTHFKNQLSIWLVADGNPAARPAESLILCVFHVSNHIVST